MQADQRPTIGSAVLIRYKGGALGEDPVDDASAGAPKRFILGTSSLPRGIEDAVMTLRKGETGVFEIPPEKGYGEYRQDCTTWYPRSILERGYDLHVGSMLFWRNPEDASAMPAWIREEKPDVVLVDFNHPLAGRTLQYCIELVDFE